MISAIQSRTNRKVVANAMVWRRIKRGIIRRIVNIMLMRADLLVDLSGSVFDAKRCGKTHYHKMHVKPMESIQYAIIRA